MILLHIRYIKSQTYCFRCDTAIATLPCLVCLSPFTKDERLCGDRQGCYRVILRKQETLQRGQDLLQCLPFFSLGYKPRHKAQNGAVWLFSGRKRHTGQKVIYGIHPPIFHRGDLCANPTLSPLEGSILGLVAGLEGFLLPSLFPHAMLSKI